MGFFAFQLKFTRILVFHLLIDRSVQRKKLRCRSQRQYLRILDVLCDRYFQKTDYRHKRIRPNDVLLSRPLAGTCIRFDPRGGLLRTCFCPLVRTKKQARIRSASVCSGIVYFDRSSFGVDGCSSKTPKFVYGIGRDNLCRRILADHL